MTSRTSNYQSCFTILVFSACACLIVYVSRASTKRLLPVVLTRYGRKLTQAELPTVYVSWASTFFARRTLPTYPTYSVHVYVCIFIIHNKYKLYTYIHVCAPRVQYIVVKVGCRGIYIAHANYIKTTSICYIVTNITILTLSFASRLAPALINSWTTSTWPAELASIRAVLPYCFSVCVCQDEQNYHLSTSLELALSCKMNLTYVPTYSVHVYVCIFIIHNKYKLCTYIHVCAARVQYIVVEVSCRGIYIAHANYIKTTSIC